MGAIIADQLPDCAVGETANGGVSYAAQLDPGELLTGTPTVDEVTTGDLTIINVGVNTARVTINGKPVAIGEAVLFTVTGMTAESYTLKILASTNSTPTNAVKPRYCKFRVVPAPT